MLKSSLLLVLLCVCLSSTAALTSHKKAEQASSQAIITVEQFEEMTGSKLSWFEKLQFKHTQRLMKKKKAPLWDAEELTEGFLPLPFFGSLLTGGLLYLVLIFTAQDRNVIRWAQWGALAAWLVVLGLTIAAYAGGGY